MGHACPSGRTHRLCPLPHPRGSTASFKPKLSSYHFHDGIISSVIIFSWRLERRLLELYLLFKPGTVERDHFSLCLKPTGGQEGPINTANQEYFISTAAMREPTCNRKEEGCKEIRRRKKEEGKEERFRERREQGCSFMLQRPCNL